ncbi:MAG TPA: GlyGly-CTERM sorting domain-containing protein [Steroidobacteraceae bacterium]
MPRESREASDAGFSAASDQMIEHFDTALSGFEAEVRAGHANVRVVRKGTSGGAGGGGAIGVLELALLAALRGMRRPVRVTISATKAAR